MFGKAIPGFGCGHATLRVISRPHRIFIALATLLLLLTPLSVRAVECLNFIVENEAIK